MDKVGAGERTFLHAYARLVWCTTRYFSAQLFFFVMGKGGRALSWGHSPVLDGGAGVEELALDVHVDPLGCHVVDLDDGGVADCWNASVRMG